MKLFVKIGIGVSVVTNIFFISLASYTHLTRDARVKENREYIERAVSAGEWLHVTGAQRRRRSLNLAHTAVLPC